MTTVFISDLHCQASAPEITAHFQRFMQTYAGQCEALYILGDLFEAWIGDDDKTPFNEAIIDALARFTKQGARLYFQHGNRDFLIGQRFAEATQATILPEVALIDLYGQPTLLLHGDSLCLDDSKHMAFRAQALNPSFQKILLAYPLFMRRLMAKYLRFRSKLHTKSAEKAIMDVTNSEVPRLLQQHQASLMIHGHTHQPSIEYFPLGQQLGCRIVLSDWGQQGNALICQRNGEKRLIYF